MTTSRIIQREFVVQLGSETLPSVTLGYAWSSFMNTYAVWPSNAGDSVTIRRTVELQKGYYYVTGTVDNYGTVNINGEYNITLLLINATNFALKTYIYHIIEEWIVTGLIKYTGSRSDPETLVKIEYFL